VKEVIATVENGQVKLPPSVRLPEGIRVRVAWEEEEAAALPPLEDEPWTEEELKADLQWATGKRFPK
jgi:hypothetical protein